MTQMATRAAKQVDTVPIALIDILRHDCFTQGFLEVAQSLPFNADFAGAARHAWFYERGRLVATEARSTWGRVPALWCETDAGSVINPQIISLAGAMFMTGAMT
jgi:hypothetical protein